MKNKVKGHKSIEDEGGGGIFKCLKKLEAEVHFHFYRYENENVILYLPIETILKEKLDSEKKGNKTKRKLSH